MRRSMSILVDENNPMINVVDDSIFTHTLGTKQGKGLNTWYKTSNGTKTFFAFGAGQNTLHAAHQVQRIRL